LATPFHTPRGASGASFSIQSAGPAYPSEFWLNLQQADELRLAEQDKALAKEVQPIRRVG
jgi:hypothetical protein